MDQKKWQLPIKRVPTAAKVDRSIIWNNVHVCYEQTFFGQMQMITYNNDGSSVAAASSNQVLLLRVPQAEGAIWNEQSARVCHSMRFRDDDKLVVQSVDQRVVVRSVDTAFERQLSGHSRDVRDATFLTKQALASGSDDTTVRVWDLISQSELLQGTSHTDYVRTLATHTQDTFFSGSYDHSVLLWDLRKGAKPLWQPLVPSSSPIERILHLAELNQLACASGDVVTIYDLRQTSKPLHQASNHTKTVMSLAYNSKHKQLVTGSLDQRVKFLSLTDGNFGVVASKKFNNPVTALAVHPEGTEFSVGMSTGKFQVIRVDQAAEEADQREEDGMHQIVAPGGVKESTAMRQEAILREKTNVVRQQLIAFQYHRALKTALYSRIPDVILSTLDELQRRCALHVAISGHIDRTVVQLMRFAVAHVDLPQFTDLMLEVLNVVFDIYGPVANRSTFFHKELLAAHTKLGESLTAFGALEECAGMIELIVNDAN